MMMIMSLNLAQMKTMAGSGDGGFGARLLYEINRAHSIYEEYACIRCVILGFLRVCIPSLYSRKSYDLHASDGD